MNAFTELYKGCLRGDTKCSIVSILLAWYLILILIAAFKWLKFTLNDSIGYHERNDHDEG